MKALLDTHTFLWAISDDARLSSRAAEVFVGPADLWFSVASIWEILIKAKMGKIPLPSPVGPYILKKMRENLIEVLPVGLDHVLRVETLPSHHSDPFDRILIAQGLEEKLPIVTADRAFSSYPVQIIW